MKDTKEMKDKTTKTFFPEEEKFKDIKDVSNIDDFAWQDQNGDDCRRIRNFIVRSTGGELVSPYFDKITRGVWLIGQLIPVVNVPSATVKVSVKNYCMDLEGDNRAIWLEDKDHVFYRLDFVEDMVSYHEFGKAAQEKRNQFLKVHDALMLLRGTEKKPNKRMWVIPSGTHYHCDYDIHEVYSKHPTFDLDFVAREYKFCCDNLESSVVSNRLFKSIRDLGIDSKETKNRKESTKEKEVKNVSQTEKEVDRSKKKVGRRRKAVQEDRMQLDIHSSTVLQSPGTQVTTPSIRAESISMTSTASTAAVPTGLYTFLYTPL